MASKKERTLRDVINYHLATPSAIANNELEIRFNTKSKDKLTKIDFDNVMRKLKSEGFIALNSNGDYSLKIQNEFTDIKSGITKMSNLRSEIKGISSIQDYCKNNSLEDINSYNISYIMKSYVKDGDDVFYPIDNDEFKFRISYQQEKIQNDTSPIVRGIKNDWKNLKKNFRFINRINFIHPEMPFISIDMSVVKSSINNKSYNIQDSGVFKNIEGYEIEIELKNNINVDADTVEKYIKKTIKIILSGIQNTNYPITNSEIINVKNNYHKILFNTEKEHLLPRDFCGPASYTLELKNIQPLTDETIIPNINSDYTVTDKADGIRKLLIVSSNGKIYFMTMNMAVEFTGMVTKNKELYNSIIDGEHILHDKNNNFINMYAAFDLYYINNKSFREKRFSPTKVGEATNDFRLTLLNNFIKELNKDIKMITGKESNFILEAKTFYVSTSEKSIFTGCRTILQKIENGLFAYETDGLIFTPCNFGVGGNKIGEASRPMKLTWAHSFKWKPPEFNTIDFLVDVKKDSNKKEIIGNLFKDGVNMSSDDQITQFKILSLHCGFDEGKHGFLNPCQDVLDDKFPKNTSHNDNSNYKPVPFYPTNPYDNDAHICHLILQRDKNYNYQMICENGDIIEDNTIVEFSYDSSKDKEYRWYPLRVRYDKTAELKSGQKNYGNAYHVANGNWHSIHAPVTSEMLSTGENIPIEALDDSYYNRNTEKKSTKNLRNFHNSGVKKRLIQSVSDRGNSLIDFSVGKGGDLSKWSNARLAFVFGIDLSRDNIENKHDGACARYLKAHKENKYTPYGLFINGNAGLNIRSGLAAFTEKGKQITKSLFGEIEKSQSLGEAVNRQYGKYSKGFDIGSCQFSLHYFFENATILQGFLRNVSECIKEGGYFIGTCYDGKKIFDALKKKKRGEKCCLIQNNDEKIWEIVKDYDNKTFEDNESCLGYGINVYQESINKYFKEYLVNFNYLIRIMENYGFKLLTNEQAKEIDMPSGMGNFKTLYKDHYKMSLNEKKISYYNNFFIFKKINNVDSEKVKITMSDESNFEVKLNLQDTESIRKKGKMVLKKNI